VTTIIHVDVLLADVDAPVISEVLTKASEVVVKLASLS
jgi:hypothetical protein